MYQKSISAAVILIDIAGTRSSENVSFLLLRRSVGIDQQAEMRVTASEMSV
jgi:hypothetical protein